MPAAEKINICEARLTGILGSLVNFIGSLLFLSGLIIGVFRLRLFAGVSVSLGFMLIITGLLMIYAGLSNLSRKMRNEHVRKFYLNYIVIRIIATILLIAFLYIVSRIDLYKLLETGLHIAQLVIALPIGIASYVVLIISIVELKNSYELIKTLTGNELFSITSFIYSIAALLIIIIIGFVILAIAPLIETIAWSALPEYLDKHEAKKSS